MGRIVIAILAVTAAVGCERWSEKRVAETKQHGDIVCQAVEAYRVKTGKYPFQLADLQPEFLREIPLPTAGAKQWGYEVIDQGTNYWLYVVGSERGPILDRSADGTWQFMVPQKK